MNQGKSISSGIQTPHTCFSLSQELQNFAYCQICGIILDLKNPTNTFHRSQTFTLVFHQIDGKQLLSEMLAKQSINRTFNQNPPHLDFREALVNYTLKLGTKLSYRRKTLHLSIAIIDQVFSKCSVTKEEIALVAIVSLITAAKMEEQDYRIPLIEDIVAKLKGQFSRNQFLYCESVIFSQVLKFNANIITPYRFAKQFLYRGALSGKEIGWLIVKEKLSYDLVDFFEEILLSFIDFSLQHYEFYHFTAAAVAAAAVACARKVFGVEKIWSQSLEYLVGYSWLSIEKCANLMIQLFAIDQQEQLEKFFSKRHFFKNKIQKAFFQGQPPTNSSNAEFADSDCLKSSQKFGSQEDNFFILEHKKNDQILISQQDNQQFDQKDLMNNSTEDQNSISQESTKLSIFGNDSQIKNQPKFKKLDDLDQSDSLYQESKESPKLNKKLSYLKSKSYS